MVTNRLYQLNGAVGIMERLDITPVHTKRMKRKLLNLIQVYHTQVLLVAINNSRFCIWCSWCQGKVAGSVGWPARWWNTLINFILLVKYKLHNKDTIKYFKAILY